MVVVVVMVVVTAGRGSLRKIGARAGGEEGQNRSVPVRREVRR